MAEESKDEDFLTTQLLQSTVLPQNSGCVILHFTATWCGPCKKLNPVVLEVMKKKPENVRYFKLDIDDNFDDQNLIRGIKID